MKPPPLSRSEIRIVESIVSKRLGEPYRQVAFDPLTIKQKRPRRYSRHRLVNAEGSKEASVFTKFGHKIVRYPKLEALLGALQSDRFRAPQYMGNRKTSGFELAVWEDLPGAWKDFGDLTSDDFDTVVDAVGDIHDLTEAASDCGVPVGTPWLNPFMAEVQAYLGTLDRPDMAAAAAQIAAVEDEILAALRSLGPLVFTHNDIAPTNLHWRDDGLAILDWEGATFAVPGCGLRLMARLPDAQFDYVVGRYHGALRTRANTFSADDLRYSIAAHEGIRSLVLGQRTKNPELLSWGLNCFHRHILKTHPNLIP